MGKYKGFQGAGMNNNKKMSGVIKQAQKMQEEMERIQGEIEEKTVEAAAGGGAVEVVVSGKKVIKSLTLDKDIVDPDDVETLQESIIAAINEAFAQVDEASEAAMSKMTGGLGGLGGFGF